VQGVRHQHTVEWNFHLHNDKCRATATAAVLLPPLLWLADLLLWLAAVDAMVACCCSFLQHKLLRLLIETEATPRAGKTMSKLTKNTTTMLLNNIRTVATTTKTTRTTPRIITIYKKRPNQGQPHNCNHHPQNNIHGNLGMSVASFLPASAIPEANPSSTAAATTSAATTSTPIDPEGAAV
jgi:hypothetical protein